MEVGLDSEVTLVMTLKSEPLPPSRIIELRRSRALSMIEEIDTLPREVQTVAYEQAKGWLASSESPDIKPRSKAARKKIAA